MRCRAPTPRGPHGGGRPLPDGTIATTSEQPAGAPPPDAGDAPHPAPTGTALQRWRARLSRPARRDAAFVAALTLLAGGLPLVVALAAVRRDGWFPSMDLALTEMRVRDVGTGDPPLVGLIGRLYGLGVRGSHPGPLSFWLLWPLYKLFGSDPEALEAATAVLNVVAIGLCVAIAQRRGGRRAALGVAAVLVLLARSYGPEMLTQPWNPHLPVIWWLAFLLAVWSVLCGDVVLLPVAVLAGSFCVQTHISYLGLVLGVGAVALAVAAWTGVRRRGSGSALDPDLAGSRGRLLRWAGGSLLLLLVLWLPPIVDQLTSSPGNGSVLRDTFVHPEDPPVGFGRRAVDLWLVHLDPSALLVRQDPVFHARGGSTLPGAALLTVWAASVVVAWRRRGRPPHGADERQRGGPEPLLRLHAVVAAAVLLGLVSFARILGDPVWWVVLWAWGTTALVLVAVGWTVVSARRDLARAATVAAGAVLVAGSLLFVADASSNEVYKPADSAVLGQVAPATAAWLRQVEHDSGRSERWLVRWEAPGSFNADPIPYGLVLELERHGFDVGTPAEPVVASVPYRVRDPADATAIVDYVVGQARIDAWRRRPDTIELASAVYFDGPVAVFATTPTPAPSSP